MELIYIRRAFEKRLMQIVPQIDTAYEGVSFVPTQGVPFQKVQLSPFSPENPTLGDGYYREVGEFQIFLNYPTNKGTTDAFTRASLTRSYFPRGLTLTEGGLEINILQTPYIAGGSIIGDRFMVPVLIPYSVGVM